MALRFGLDVLADQIIHVIEAAEAALRLEQAVHGLDVRDEVSLQALLAEGLGASYEVAREVCYPSSAGQRRAQRLRCDLVLSPRGRPLRREDAQPSLFDPPQSCPPQEALWLEVKTAHQFRAGGRRHPGYGAQWRQAAVSDLRKMAAEPLIRQAALLLVVFHEAEEVVQQHLDLFETVLEKAGVLTGFRQARHVPILDRIGHRGCSVILWPTVQRG